MARLNADQVEAVQPVTPNPLGTLNLTTNFPELNENQTRMLKRMIAEVISPDEKLPIDDREWNTIRDRNQLRAEQRKRAGL